MDFIARRILGAHRFLKFKRIENGGNAAKVTRASVVESVRLDKIKGDLAQAKFEKDKAALEAVDGTDQPN